MDLGKGRAEPLTPTHGGMHLPQHFGSRCQPTPSRATERVHRAWQAKLPVTNRLDKCNMQRGMNALVSHTLDDLRQVFALFGREHPEISRVELFGSVARGEHVPTSDVDVVVSFVPGSLPRGLAGFEFLDELEGKLAARLGRPVNLIEQGAVENARRIGNHSLPRALARDGRLLYEAHPAAN